MNTNGARQIPLPLIALRSRALVLALGESVRPAWWKTEFMNETGLRFLERLYPRTSFQAAVHAAGRAACDVHDRAVGRVGVYHLFRLPESLEAEMSRIPPDFDEEFVSRFRAGLGHPDKLMELLALLCSGASGTDVAPGAKRIGTDKELMAADGFEKTAAVYLHAFAHGKAGFPYFAGDRSGGRG
ncbi:MAG: BrxE family protein [Desulfobacteria bacterium]